MVVVEVYKAIEEKVVEVMEVVEVCSLLTRTPPRRTPHPTSWQPLGSSQSVLT